MSDNPEDFVNLFQQAAISRKIRNAPGGGASGDITTNTYDSPSGKTLRYTKAGNRLNVQTWATGHEGVVEKKEIGWNGNQWVQVNPKLAFTTPQLVEYLIQLIS